MSKFALDVKLEMNKTDLATRNDLADLTVAGKRQAVSRAQNKTLTGLRTDIVRTIRERYNIKSGEIRSRIFLRRSKPSALYARLTVLRGRRMLLSMFAPRPSKPVSDGGRRPKKGISNQILKGKPRKTLAGSFLQQGKYGLVEMKRSGPERESAHIKYGPSFMSVLQVVGTQQDLQAMTDERFRKNLAHEANFLKAKERGRV